jgi:hypothetical protein
MGTRCMDRQESAGSETVSDERRPALSRTFHRREKLSVVLAAKFGWLKSCASE